MYIIVRMEPSIITTHEKVVQDVVAPFLHQGTPATLDSYVTGTGKKLPGRYDLDIKVGSKDFATLSK